ncbi:ribonuclease H-like domain-containing protein [Tanacetum coccineum]
MVTRFRVGSNKPTQHLNFHVSTVSPLLKTYREAFLDCNWTNTMQDEYNALIKNRTWTLVPRPPDTNVVRCMWLFGHKQFLADGIDLVRYKGRLCKTVVLPSWRALSMGSSRLLAPGFNDLLLILLEWGFIIVAATPLYLSIIRAWILHLLLYVDDIVLTTSSSELLQRIIRSLHQEFAMTDLGSLNYFLGISVSWDSSGMFLSQKKYAVEILERTNMVNCNPSQNPVDTESKLSNAGDEVSDPTLYRSLADADLAGCPTTRRSTSGYCVFLGNNLHSWFSKRQPTLSRSSAEAEDRGVANAVAETYLVAVGQVRVLHVPSRYQFADIFTKGLPSSLFEEFRSSLSVRCPPAQTAREC